MFDKSEWDDAWETADTLPMWAAAYLWINKRPLGDDANRFEELMVNDEVFRILNVFTLAFMAGKFDPDPDNALREREGNYQRSRVTRAALYAFAKHRNERPAFLFPEGRTPDKKGLAIGAQSNRGKPPVYNWPGVKKRLKLYAAEHGAAQSLTELLHLCSDFATELHPRGRTPDDSTIRAAIKKHSLDAAAGLSLAS
jgi:hypothetical protein